LTKHLKHLSLVTGLLLIAGLTVSCRQAGTAVDLDALLGDSVAEATQPAGTEAAEATQTELPAPSPTPETDENCVNCHSNQELLQALATEAEPEESLSSGEG
jgi:hypothetical protein